MESARFCQHCGASVATVDPEPTESLSRSLRLNVLGWTLGGTFLLSFILTVVFQWPVLILGAFLPFLGRRRR